MFIPIEKPEVMQVDTEFFSRKHVQVIRWEVLHRRVAWPNKESLMMCGNFHKICT